MKNTRRLLGVFVAVVVVVITVLVGIIVFLLKANNGAGTNEVNATDNNTKSYGAIAEIGTEVGIITDGEIIPEKDLNFAIAFTTNYQRDIYVRNGNEAEGYIGNHEENFYDNMYVQIFLNDDDDALGEEIYLSKIIPRGSHIEKFTLEKKLAPGDYRATLVHACLDDEGVLINNTPVIVEIHVSE